MPKTVRNDSNQSAFFNQHGRAQMEGHHMAEIEYLPRNIAFGPEAVDVMGTAFDEACRLLGHDVSSPTIKTRIAERIFASASAGERDPGRLIEFALSAARSQPLKASGD
jgi:hypothetical protein